MGSVKANRREPKSCLGRVFNFKLGCLQNVYNLWPIQKQPSLDLKMQPRFLSCQLKFVQGENLKVVWSEFSTISWPVLLLRSLTASRTRKRTPRVESSDQPASMFA
jgi:hypothetical protein